MVFSPISFWSVVERHVTHLVRWGWTLVLVLVMAVAGGTVGRAANYYVENAAQFNAGRDRSGAVFTTLSAGDRVYLKGGTWGGITRTLTGSMTDEQAQSDPALMVACDADYHPTPGGVVINGLSQLQLGGAGIVLAGLTFGPGSGMAQVGSTTDYDDNDGVAWLIKLRSSSRYITLSHLKFDHCGRDNTEAGNDHYGPWIQVNGYGHVVQYCEFEGRDFDPDRPRTAIRNATIAIYKGASDTVYGHHGLRYCYFGERKVPVQNDPHLYAPANGDPVSDMANGWETIRIGDSGSQDADLRVTIEYCAFYHAIHSPYGGADDRPGDFEIISSKSRNNVYRYNTFLNSYGQLCFRHGDYGVAEGNVFLGGGAYDAAGNIVLTEPRNSAMSGVRAIGFGHTIANNYFYRLGGTGYTSAVCLVRGDTDPGTLERLGNGNPGSGYETANYTQVLSNTFIDCKAIALDHDGGGAQPVFGTRFYNNLVYYSGNVGGPGITGRSTAALTSRGGLARGNYIYSATSAQLGQAAAMLGSTGNTITTQADPLLTGADGVMAIPVAGSPVRGAAAVLPAVNDTSTTGAGGDLAAHVTAAKSRDVRGLARPASGQDIGAYEGDASGTGARPLRRGEVGTAAGVYPGRAEAPSARFDLSHYSLTLPVDSAGGFSGAAVTIDPARLADGSYAQPPYFRTSADGAMVFYVPVNSAVGGTSSSPRSELRERVDPASTLVNWTTEGTHQLTAELVVDSLGAGTVAIGQIHGKAPNIPLVILRFNNSAGLGTVTASVKYSPDGARDPVTGKTDFTLTFGAAGNVGLGRRLVYKIELVDGVVRVTVNGATQSLDLGALGTGWENATFYFKAGAYYVTRDPGGAPAQVSFHALSASHSGFGIVPPEVPALDVGQRFERQLRATGGALRVASEAAIQPEDRLASLTWSVAAGALPPGMTLGNRGLLSGTPTAAGTYRVTFKAADAAVPALTATREVTFIIGGPAIAVEPQSRVVMAGEAVEFTVQAAGTGKLTYQWSKDGVPIDGATAATLTLHRAQAADAGVYMVEVRNAAGAVTSAGAVLTVNGTRGRLTNLSVRAAASGGEETLVVGFVVAGSGKKSILVRGIGPGLVESGVSEAIPDPQLKLFDRDGVLLADNDDWDAVLESTFARLGASALKRGSKDAALLADVAPAPHTAHVVTRTEGIALAEVYDADGNAESRLTNISGRARVSGGSAVLIAGFVIAEDYTTVLVRAVGPGLASRGVEDALADPVLRLFGRDGVVIAANDDWPSTLAESAARVGAFSLEAGSKDAGMLITLAPGVYTAMAVGAEGRTGVALVEIYEVR